MKRIEDLSASEVRLAGERFTKYVAEHRARAAASRTKGTEGKTLDAINPSPTERVNNAARSYVDTLTEGQRAEVVRVFNDARTAGGSAPLSAKEALKQIEAFHRKMEGFRPDASNVVRAGGKAVPNAPKQEAAKVAQTFTVDGRRVALSQAEIDVGATMGNAPLSLAKTKARAARSR